MHKDVTAWRIAVRAFFVICFFLPSIALAEGEEPKDLMPGVYSDPGISASQGFFGGQQQAQVDPFTGMLSVRATDLSIPGQGGLDITLTRSYHSLSPGEYPENSWIGTGWSMHYGQLRTQYLDRMCNPLLDGTVLDNPVFVTPDGISHRLALAYSTFNLNSGGGTEQINIGTAYISDDYGMLFCQPDGSVYYKTPTGLRYDFNDVISTPNGPTKYVWHVSRVTDLNGNYLDVEYISSGVYGGFGKLISRISASDGRVVNFTYAGASTNTARLDTVEYEGLIWTYEYFNGNFDFDVVEDKTYFSAGNYLSRVIDPEGLIWTYEYWPFNQNGEDGAGSIKKIVNPHGGGSEYVYQKRTMPYLGSNNDHISVIEYRKFSSGSTLSFSDDGFGNHVLQGSFNVQGNWYYSYSSDVSGDTTTIEGPYEDRVYYHYGLGEATGENIWRVGTLKRLEIYAAGESAIGNPVREETYTWDGHVISRENNSRPERTIFDHEFRVPRLLQQTIIQDGVTYTTQYQQFTSVDASFPSLPQKVIESTSGASVNGSREISKSYFFDFNNWVMGLRVAEATGDGVWYSNQYNGLGQLVESNEKGAVTSYAYDDEGNLLTVTLGDNPPTSYTNYELGVARTITLPNGGVLTRTLDEFARITSETDANQNTTGYSYDDIGRKTGVTPPIGLATSISWGANSATISRGPYTREVRFDGFGNTTEVTISATDVSPITTISRYDLDGRLTRQDLTGVAYGQSTYVTYDYDTLGRLISTEHPGGTRAISRISGMTTVTNERGFDQVTTSKAFGSPDNAFAVQIDVPDMQPIYIEIDDNGQMLKVTQDWLERTYEYNTDMTLWRFIEPESGIRIYSYATDGTGHIETEYNQKLVDRDSGIASFGKSFDYDEMGRLVQVRSTKQSINFYNPYYADGYDRKTWVKRFEYDLVGNLLSSEVQTNEAMFLKSSITNTYVMMSEVPRVVKKTFDYDDMNRMLSESLSVDSKVLSLAYRYSDLGVVDQLTYPDGEKISLNTNGLGLVNQVLPYVNQVDYHINGLPKYISYANGTSVTTTLNDRLLLDTSSFSAANDSFSHAYQYDSAGNIERIDELVSADVRSFGYDAADRLISAVGPWGDELIDYDNVGNIKTRTVDGVVRNYQYNTRNVLSSISGGVSRNYQFDDWGAAVKAGDYELDRGVDNEIVGYRYSPFVYQAYPATTHMTYDADGRRTSVTQSGNVKRYFIYSSSGKLMHELNEVTSSYANYVYLGNRIIAKSSVILDCADDYDGDGIPHCVEQQWMLNPFNAADGELDSDGDGLSNSLEYSLGGSAIKLDSDGDGMPDSYEYQAGLNIAVNDASADADGDGYRNIEEYERGQDPLGPDLLSPLNSVVTYSSAEDIVVSWSGYGPVASYKVYASSLPGVTESTTEVYITELPYFRDAGMASGQKRYYRVSVVNAAGETVLSPEVSATPQSLSMQQLSAESERAANQYSAILGVDATGTAYAIRKYEMQRGTTGDLRREFVLVRLYADGEVDYRKLDFLDAIGGGQVGISKAAVGPLGHVFISWDKSSSLGLEKKLSLYSPNEDAWQHFELDAYAYDAHVAIDGSVVLLYGNPADREPAIAEIRDGVLRTFLLDPADLSTEDNWSQNGRMDVSENGDIVVYWYDGNVDKFFVSVKGRNDSAAEVTDLSALGDINYASYTATGDVFVASEFGYVVRHDGVWGNIVPSADRSRYCVSDAGDVAAYWWGRQLKADTGVLQSGAVVWRNDVLTLRSTLPDGVTIGSAGIAPTLGSTGDAGGLYVYGASGWSLHGATGSAVTACGRATNPVAGGYGSAGYSYYGPDANYFPVAAGFVDAGIDSNLADDKSAFVITEGEGNDGAAGASLILSHARSFDIDNDYVPLQVSWTQVSGPAAQIRNVDADLRQVSVALPEVTVDTNFTFLLTVTDADGNVSTDQVDVLLRDNFAPPVIDGGESGTVSEGGIFQLRGSGSEGEQYTTYASTPFARVRATRITKLGPYSWDLEFNQVDGPDTAVDVNIKVTDSLTGRAAFDIVPVTVINEDGSPFVPLEIDVTHTVTSGKNKVYSITMTPNKPAVIYLLERPSVIFTGGGCEPKVQYVDGRQLWRYCGPFEFRDPYGDNVIKYYGEAAYDEVTPDLQYQFGGGK